MIRLIIPNLCYVEEKTIFIRMKMGCPSGNVLFSFSRFYI